MVAQFENYLLIEMVARSRAVERGAHINSHSHRGFSPVTDQSYPTPCNRFNGFE